ncbi:MAG: Nramp family divalent metal transporter [Candidatus Caldarchaeales archaeon]
MSEEKTVVLGDRKVSGLKLSDLPLYTGLLAMLGPGFIWASLAQGSGELIWWPYLTAKYGPSFIWLFLPAAFLQYWVNLEIIRYTALTGETTFTMFRRVSRYYAMLMWIMLFITFAWFGGYAGAGGTALRILTGLPAGWTARDQTLFWAYIIVLLTLVVIVFGHVVYFWVEQIMKVVVIITVAGLIIALVGNVEGWKYGPEFTSYLFTPQAWPSNWDPRDTPTLVTCIAFAGMGGFFNIMYSYWIRDKRVGMASYVGRVTSPITGKPEAIPAFGYTFPDTSENRERWKKWLRYLQTDNALAVGINILTTVIMMFLAYSILFPAGKWPGGWELVGVQSEFFGKVMGPVGASLFLIVATFFISDSYLGIIDAMSRMHSDFVYSNFEKARKKTFRWWYYVWAAYLFIISAITLYLIAPGPLLILGGVLNMVAFALYCPVLIYVNWIMVPKSHPAGKFVRPHYVSLIFMLIATAVYIYFAAWFIYFGLTTGIWA